MGSARRAAGDRVLRETATSLLAERGVPYTTGRTWTTDGIDSWTSGGTHNMFKDARASGSASRRRLNSSSWMRPRGSRSRGFCGDQRLTGCGRQASKPDRRSAYLAVLRELLGTQNSTRVPRPGWRSSRIRPLAISISSRMVTTP